MDTDEVKADLSVLFSIKFAAYSNQLVEFNFFKI